MTDRNEKKNPHLSKKGFGILFYQGP